MLNNLGRLLHAGLVRWQRERMREELLSLNEHALRDAGFSRELLLEGVRAWPWHAAADDGLAPLDFSAMPIRQVYPVSSAKQEQVA